jgi:RND family efflux transporter MFP subunit
MRFNFKKNGMPSSLTRVIFFAAVSTVFMASCSGEKTRLNTINEAPVFVRVTSPGNVPATGLIEVSGQVEAIRSVNISTRVMGYITKMQVKVGDKVKAGQLLFTVNSTDLLAKKSQAEAMIDQADAAWQSAQKDYERFTSLYKQQSASAKELDAITLQYRSAKANAASARNIRDEVSAQLAYTTVVAPFSGFITQKLMDQGSISNPGMPVLTIEQEGNLQVSATVPESQISFIHLGDDAIMIAESIHKIIKGKIVQINPSSQFTGGQYIIKLSVSFLDSKELYSGMYMHIQLPLQDKTGSEAYAADAVMVPVSALVQHGQLTGIYTVSSQNTAILRWLRVGKVLGDKVEVLSGLGKNEDFIISAEGKLYNGAAVKIK